MGAHTCFDRLSRHEFSKRSATEVVGYVRGLLLAHQCAVDEVAPDLAAIPEFVNELMSQKSVIDRESRHVIFEGIDRLSKVKEQAALAWIIANILGEPMVQNHLGRRIIEVYDREGRTMQEGARYHQSRQGDNPHTDSMNDPAAIDYLVLSCVSPAAIGGETIIVDGFAVYRMLQRFPEALATLRQPFWLENRGMAMEEHLFEMPVVSLDDSGEPHIRYLRPYIESAHRKAGQPLNRAQTAAFDTLDAILELSQLQHRVMLQRGQTLVGIDTQIMHARTNFVDRSPPSTIDMETADIDKINRYFLRVWVKQRASEQVQQMLPAA